MKWIVLGAILMLAPPAAAETVYANKCGPGFYSSFSGEVLGDAPSTTSQKTVNCFAWQQFIGLNWPAAGHRFGEAGDRAPVRWQSFPGEADILRPASAPPSPDERAPLPAACAARVKAAGFSQPEDLTILQAPAGRGQKRSRINSTEQAGASDNEAAWVGASNGANLWYEIRLNRPEADFIVANRLYDAADQAKFIAAGHPFVLPMGEADGHAGAIELKAAWMEVPDPKNPKWAYFKTSEAAILDAADSDCRLTEVALVGLHIIQKTALQPSFFWATFEHIDNVPDESGPVSGSYNLLQRSLPAAAVAVNDPRCLVGPEAAAQPRNVTIGCAPNSRPPYRIGGDCPRPAPSRPPGRVPISRIPMTSTRWSRPGIAKNLSGFGRGKITNWSMCMGARQGRQPRGAAGRPRPPAGDPPVDSRRQHDNGNLSPDDHLHDLPRQCGARQFLQLSADFSFVFQAAGR